ncbi:MAG: type II toxin-antitoxin system RelE family toxin [Bryobacteraceae bacterium]
MALKIDWSDDARADIRALDRPTAMFIFDAILRYAETAHGDVKALQGKLQGRFRLRAGDYRIIFSPGHHAIRIHRVKDRKDAYR